MWILLCSLPFLLTLPFHARNLLGRKIITLIYYWGLALFKCNNHLTEQVPLQGFIDPMLFQKFQEAVTLPGDRGGQQKRTQTQSRLEGSGRKSPAIGHRSNASVTLGAFFFFFLQNRGWRRENAQRLQWAWERERAQADSCQGVQGAASFRCPQERSSALDHDSKELNFTTQPDQDGICFWVQNGTLIKINLDK